MTDREHMKYMLKRADEREARIQALEVQRELLCDALEAKNEAIAKKDAVMLKMYAVMKRMAAMIPENAEKTEATTK